MLRAVLLVPARVLKSREMVGVKHLLQSDLRDRYSLCVDSGEMSPCPRPTASKNEHSRDVYEEG